MKSSVPKFGSFKPKVEETTKASSQHDREDKDQAQSRHYSHRKHRPAVAKPHAGSHRSQKHEGLAKEPVNKLQHGHTEELFKVDHKGDGDNARYGSNSRWQVPNYREPSRRTLMGAEREPRNQPGSSLLSKMTREDRAQLMSNGKLIKSSSKSLVIQGENRPSQDYIPLQTGSRRKDISYEMQTLGVSFSEQISDSSSDDDDQDSSEHDDTGNETDSNLQRHLHMLQDKVKNVPSSLETWLELVNFQDAWVREGMRSDAPLTGLELCSTVAKLQLALLDDAIKAIGAEKSKFQILGLRRIEIGSSIWDRNVLNQEWQHFLEKSDRSPRVLQAYIKYRQSDAEDYDWEEVRDLFKELFKTHESRLETQDCYMKLARHVLEVTRFLRDSGYREAAVAVWQASIYGSLENFRSDNIVSDPDGTALEAWWDSEEPRPGERGSFVLDSSQTSPESLQENEQEQSIKQWAIKELELMSQAWIPGRSEDDIVEEDDAFRTVLYPDIDVFVRKWSSPVILLNSFLLFCGLPEVLVADGLQSCSLSGQFFLEQDIEKSISRPTTQSSLLLPSQSWIADSQCLCGTENDVYFSFRDVPKNSILTKLAANVLEQHVAATIHTRPQDGDFVEYFFALLCHMDPSLARQKARTLLDGGRSKCMRLYLCLALIELRLKGAASADAVFVAAINMSKHLEKEQPGEHLRLWNIWTWATLQSGDKDLALRRIVSIALENPPTDLMFKGSPSQAQILKTQTHLRQLRDEALSNKRWSKALQAGQLLTSLAFLSTLNMSSTAAVLATNATYFATYIPTTSPVLIALHQHLALLLYLHVTLRFGSYSPENLAVALAPSITSYPTNGLLLNVYAQVFAHGNILDDRVRSIARQILHVDAPPETSRRQSSQSDDSSKSIIPSLFSIQRELSRQPELGSTQSSIRTVFERTLEQGQHRDCQIVWTMYLDYECLVLDSLEKPRLDQSDSRSDGSQRRLATEFSVAREKVRGVFYRGLHALPGSKDWIMRALAVSVVRSVLTPEEQRLLVEKISDRGLRLHVEPALD